MSIKHKEQLITDLEEVYKVLEFTVPEDPFTYDEDYDEWEEMGEVLGAQEKFKGIINQLKKGDYYD